MSFLLSWMTRRLLPPPSSGGETRVATNRQVGDVNATSQGGPPPTTDRGIDRHPLVSLRTPNNNNRSAPHQRPNQQGLARLHRDILVDLVFRTFLEGCPSPPVALTCRHMRATVDRVVEADGLRD